MLPTRHGGPPGVHPDLRGFGHCLPMAQGMAGGAGSANLKNRIEGFGNGPAPPPLPESTGDRIWDAIVDAGHEMGLGNQVEDWYNSARDGLDSAFSMFDFLDDEDDDPAAQAAEQRRHPPGQGRPNNARGGAPGKRLPEQETPGMYRIACREALVSETQALGGKRLAKLSHDDVVNVVEVVIRADEGRVRGRIEYPVGWISLLDTRTGYRWATKERQGSALPDPGAPEQQAGVSQQQAEVPAAQPPPPPPAPQDLLDLGEATPATSAVSAPTSSLLDLEGADEQVRVGRIQTICEAPIQQAAVVGACATDTSEPSLLDLGGVSEATSSTPIKGTVSGEFQVGEVVFRRGQEAVVVKIDRTVDPPSYTVRLAKDGREVGTEAHLLSRERSLSSGSPSQSRLGGTGTELLGEEPQSLVPRLPPPPTGNASAPSEADMLGVGGQADMLGVGGPAAPASQAADGDACARGAEQDDWGDFERAAGNGFVAAHSRGASGVPGAVSRAPAASFVATPIDRGLSFFDPCSSKDMERREALNLAASGGASGADPSAATGGAQQPHPLSRGLSFFDPMSAKAQALDSILG